MAIALLAVALNPETVLVARQLRRVTAEHERTSDHYIEMVTFTGNDQPTQVAAEAFRNHRGDYRIRVVVARPRPRLHAIDVSFRGHGPPPLPVNGLLLEAPGGDWPPVIYGASDNGALRFAADGLDSHTTTVDFFLLADSVAQVPAELAVDITIDLRSPPSLTSWQGSTQVHLPIASLGE